MSSTERKNERVMLLGRMLSFIICLGIPAAIIYGMVHEAQEFKKMKERGDTTADTGLAFIESLLVIPLALWTVCFISICCCYSEDRAKASRNTNSAAIEIVSGERQPLRAEQSTNQSRFAYSGEQRDEGASESADKLTTPFFAAGSA